MKKTFFVLFAALFSVSAIFAQVSPTPVINNEVRDISSVRSRSMELERLKRDANKISLKNSVEIEAKFAEIKQEFENLQKLQAAIIKTYTTGKTIDYAKISHYADEMRKNALKLNENLFVSNPDQDEKDKTEKEKKTKTVRDLIIELDKIINSFINSALFSNNKIVDSNVSEKAGKDLEQIIKLSVLLTLEAKKH